jgi:hypothetical protein
MALACGRCIERRVGRLGGLGVELLRRELGIRDIPLNVGDAR